MFNAGEDWPEPTAEQLRLKQEREEREHAPQMAKIEALARECAADLERILCATDAT